MSNKSEKKFLEDDIYAIFKDRKYFYAVGRRKSSTAQVRVYPEGKGKFYINNLDITAYFTTLDWKNTSLAPLLLANQVDGVDLSVKVSGGGKKGQADSVSLGIARALLEMEPELRSSLKGMGYLTRDARVKERKKYGLKRARRAPQWSKR